MHSHCRRGTVLCPTTEYPLASRRGTGSRSHSRGRLLPRYGFSAVITLLRRIPREYAAPALVLSAVAPYLIFGALSGTLLTASFLVLAALAAVLAYWWLVFPRNAVSDLGFLLVVAAVYLSRAFGPVFALPLAADSLGRMAWLHTAILSALLIGRVEDPGLGFWPKAKEWRTGPAHLRGVSPRGPDPRPHPKVHHLGPQAGNRLESPANVPRHALGSGLFRGVLLPGPPANLVHPLAARQDRRPGSGIAALRLRPPLLPSIPQLALRRHRRRGRPLLRPRIPANRKRPSPPWSPTPSSTLSGASASTEIWERAGTPGGVGFSRRAASAAP